MMVLVPVPIENVRDTAPHWVPFVEAIARRSGCTAPQLVDEILTGLVHPILIWEPETLTAHALIGLRFFMRGDDRVAEWVWMTGRCRKSWEHLLPELERYCKEHLGCAALRAIARPGWLKILKPKGYHMTHVVAEREL